MNGKMRLLIMMVVFLVALPAAAQQWTYFSPQQLTTGDSRLTIEPPFHPYAVEISSTAAGDLQWVILGLSMPGGAEIDSVRVCYEISSPGVFISQVRVNSMTTPESSLVLQDLSLDLLDPGPTCVTQYCPLLPQVNGTISIGLRLNFTDPSGAVRIGSIAVHTRPALSAVDNNPPAQLPSQSWLNQNKPNPFNPSTVISFELPYQQRVQLDVYGIDGKHLRSLANETMESGSHDLRWDGRDDRGRTLASGVYLYRLVTSAGEETRRMALVR